jgi:hypothetical protein
MGAPSSWSSGSPPDILEHQHGPTALAHEAQRPHGPSAIQLILQAVFVGEAIEA